MTQYNVTYQVGDLVATRSLTLMEPTLEYVRRELLRRGLISEEVEVRIISIEERFGQC